MPHYAIGIHPYDVRNHNGLPPNQAADAVYDRVVELYTDARNRSG